MQTVIETPAYLASAKDENVSDQELKDIVSFIAANPDAGDIMPGTGGARKLRFGGKGKGKSGGYRIITFMPTKTCRCSCWIFTARTRKRTYHKQNGTNSANC
ncbi:addiction module toxin RelE [Brucella pseudogrignonensis]|uniref:addiction module toxin RelE n=1 Tax=Brucella pseudogrignonensis TaxID=419475 RepID=UPI001F36775C|nr:addiction module toxin RelE [Brucella pseudogrignonensis]